jgi:hypothetical protein
VSCHQEQIFVQYDSGLRGEWRCIVKAFGVEAQGTERSKGEALASALARLSTEVLRRASKAV